MIDTETSTAAPDRLPTVLAVLVVKDAERWLRETLSSLAAQRYPRLGIVAVDNASTDGSAEILEEALSSGRVRRLPEDRGFAGAVAEVFAQGGAARADFLLLLHDDAALDPDSVQRLVQAAVGIPGLTEVGIVGGKVVGWDDPRELIDVGRSADRFGHAFSPLQPGEIDQGQFDRVLEVLAVHGSAMLIAREAWQAIGAPDERVGTEYADLDLCWRARVTGFRVLMTPLARIRHRGASARGERGVADRGVRGEEDRAALAAMLKNYGAVSLLLYLPLAAMLGVARLAYLLLARRFEESLDVVAAWGWNVRHLIGTLRRRRRVQRRRRVRDRALRRFTESAGLRLPRWFQTAERILEEQREIEEEDAGRPVARRLRDRTASLVSAHPVIVAVFVGSIVVALAARHLLDPRVVMGGQLPRFPAAASEILRELVSGVRTTALGGGTPASPALGAVAGLSWILLGSTSLAQKALLAAGPVLAAVLAYRAHVRLTGRPGPSVVAAAGYALSGIVLWSFSEGRVGPLIALAILPALLERLEEAFSGTDDPSDKWRSIAGLAVTLAVGVAFDPGVVLVAALAIGVQLLFGHDRREGAWQVLVGAIGAAVLLFPFVPALVGGGGRALGSALFTRDLAEIGRLVLGEAPGTWFAAAFLPIGAAIALALVSSEHRTPALRAAVLAGVALALAWCSGAGWLPAASANAPMYLGLAAAAMAAVLAFGAASVRGLGRQSFGARHLGTAALTAVLAGGLGLQAIAAAIGGWEVGGPAQVPAAWAVVEGVEAGAFRVLWVGANDGSAFPAPGGEPEGLAAAGDASLRFAITGREGRGVEDLARPLVGPGADRLELAIRTIVSGRTSHAGALLAPFGVRFVVADPDRLPAPARARLDAQADLDLVPVTGLSIYRNAAAIPPGSIVQPSDGQLALIRSADNQDIARLRLELVRPLAQVPGGWAGRASDQGVALVSTEFDDAWTTQPSSPERVFGWATSFDVAPGPVRMEFGAQTSATIEAWVLALLWLGALWVTRKPVAR